MANNNNRRKQTKKNWSKAAKTNANKNNYQDAFSDREKAKSKYPVDCKSSDNDPSWYTPNGQMLKDVASINFGLPTGLPIMRENIQEVGNSVDPDPGILVFHYLPTLSAAGEATDPFNVAMNKLYQKVRSATSGTSYYEGPDLMMAVAAIGGAYTFYEWMVRLYGTMNNYDLLNRYTPQALVKAMGADFDDLQLNQANFRTYINQFANRLSSFAIPQDLDFIKRNLFMCENIYMDASSPRAQYYIYNPIGFWNWTVEQPSTGTDPVFGMNLIPFLSASTGNLVKYQQIVNYGNSMLDPLFQSEDIRYMTSDIIKAYGGSLLTAMPIAETYRVIPQYNAEVLSQMENATLLPKIFMAPLVPSSGTFKWEVRATRGLNNAYITSTYKYPQINSLGVSASSDVIEALNAIYDNVYNQDDIINFHGIQSPTPEQVMVATRCKYIGPVTVTAGSVQGVAYPIVTLTPTATEIIAGASLWYNDGNGGYAAQDMDKAFIFNNISGTPNWLQKIPVLCNLSKFDWHPRLTPIILAARDVTASGWAINCPTVMDIDNFSYISKQVLDNINYTAALGLFVPKSLQ